MSNLSKYFPVGLQAQWQFNIDIASPTLADWLLDSNSLTSRLVANCEHFRVELLGQKIISCPATESCSAIQKGEQVLVREVLLICDEVPHVFARSLLPLASLTGEQKHLATLGEQPLGQAIFNNPSLRRAQIEIATFDHNSAVGQLSQQFVSSPLPPFLLWGRRSLFYIDAKPLSVAEVFLPASNAYGDIA